MTRLLPRDRLLRRSLVLSALFLCGTGLIFALRAIFGEAFYTVYTPFARTVLFTLSWVTSVFPFSVSELVITLGVTVAPLLLLILFFRAAFSSNSRAGRVLLRYLALLLCIATALLFCFYLFWGMSYGAPPLAEQLGLEVRTFSTDELLSVAERVRDELNEASASVSRNDDGTLSKLDFRETAKHAAEAVSSYTGLRAAPAKGVLNSELMSYATITGIFIPHMAECNVNTRNRTAGLCFTAAHEMMHRWCVAPEDEANFAAFLVLYEHGSSYARYSALFSAWIYLAPQIKRADSPAYTKLYYSLSDGVRADLKQYDTLWNAYRGTVIEQAASSANNAYLELQGESDGIKSYGRMVDLLIAYYLS